MNSDKFTIRQATRSGVIPLISCFGSSGGGKTMSALLLMRGIVGQKGKIRLVDSESGRGSLFADIIPGGYEVIDIEPPFTPERYLEAFDIAEKGADGVVIDSLSHCYSGEGGILDMQEDELQRMAGDSYQKRDACRLSSWIKPKMEMKRFIGRILRARTALICCLRGDPKTHMVKNEQGKNVVVTDQFSTPIFDSKFIYELLLNLETYSKDGQGGYVIPRKITHPSLASLLPKPNEQISVRHGELLAQWCSGTPVAKSATTQVTTSPLVGLNKPATQIHEKAPAVADNSTAGISTAALKRKLWELAGPYHMGSKEKLNQWLIDEMLMREDQTVQVLTANELDLLIASVEGWIAKGHGA